MLKNDGARRGTSATACSASTFKTKANSIDADVIAHAARRRSRRPSSDFRALVIANEGEHFCVGANLFLVVMAASQKQWDAHPRDGQGATRTRRSA